MLDEKLIEIEGNHTFNKYWYLAALSREFCKLCALEYGSLRHIKAYQAQWPTGTQHDMSSMGVRVDIKLSARSDITRHTQRTAHNDDLTDTLNKTGLVSYSQSDICQRANGDKRNLARSIHYLLDNKIDSMLLHSLASRRR